MFMRNNRAKNGAPQPEAVAAADRPAQRSQEVLSPNDMSLGQPQHRTFQPDMGDLSEINQRHYRGGLDEANWPDYENKIPVGPCMP